MHKDYGRHFIRYIRSTQLVMTRLDISWPKNTGAYPLAE